MPLLPANKKRNAVKVVDAKSVEHKGVKLKLLLAEDGTVYKVKRSRMENNVEAGQYMFKYRLFVLSCQIFPNVDLCVNLCKPRNTLIFCSKISTISYSSYPFFRPFEAPKVRRGRIWGFLMFRFRRASFLTKSLGTFNFDNVWKNSFEPVGLKLFLNLIAWLTKSDMFESGMVSPSISPVLSYPT